MFDLTNLSDVEFEQLCQDIMQKKLNLKLERYARGKDGGIDIADCERNARVIIQAKHYSGSTVSSLVTSLRNEVGKIHEKKPEKYFVFTSLSLTRDKKKEIYDLFSEYMEDLSCVIAKEEIEDFLADDKNSEIVKKHYKLWLCSSNVLSLIQNQDVFIDCEELMKDIETLVPFFVETGSYMKAKHMLGREKVVILVGAPGVGKTVLSKMLLLDCASEGYAVRFTSTNEVTDIKKTLSRNKEKKEVVLLDDFLGQHYLKLEDKKPNELKTLFSFIENNPNKRIILNSRIIILNEAAEKFRELFNLMEKYDDQKHVVDMDKESILDKAKILYNHIHFNRLPKEYFAVLKRNELYLSLIRHKNYNPRIVEYVTKKRNYETQEPEKYGEYVIKNFDNPMEVWANEFTYRMEPIDRIFMNTLYSLTDSMIELETVKEAFYRRLETESIDTSKNRFEEVVRRLNESVIKQIKKGDSVEFSVLNPSINDYLRYTIQSNEVEQVKIIKASVYIDQATKVANSLTSKTEIKEKLFGLGFGQMKARINSPYFHYLEFLFKNKIFDKNEKEKVQIALVESLNEKQKNLSFGLFILIKKSLKKDFYEFYQLEELYLKKENLSLVLALFDDLSSLEDLFMIFISRLKKDEVEVSEENIEVYEDDEYISLLEPWMEKLFRISFEDNLSKEIESMIADELEDIVREYVVEESVYIPEIEEDEILKSVNEDGVLKAIEDRINTLWSELISDLSDEVQKEIDFSRCHCKTTTSDFYIQDALDSLQAKDQTDYSEPDYSEAGALAEIRLMFGR